MTPEDLDPVPGAAPAAPPAPARAPEEAAWAAVLDGWDDEGAHRAYLARFADLDGLAVAGRRYRAVLEARPGDPIAARWRDEIVKRATVAGLAQLPRTAPPVGAKLPRTVRSVLIASAIALVLGVALSFGRTLLAGLGALWPR